MKGKRPEFWKMTPAELEAYRDERAAAVLQALRDGKTLREIDGGGPADPSVKHKRKEIRQPAIWTHASINRYRTTHPEWSAEVDRLAALNREAAYHKRGSVGRSITCCKNGHEYTPDNIRWYGRAGSGKKTFRKCKKCETHWQQNPTVTIEKAREIVAGLRSGETIRSITQNGSPTRIAGFYQVRKLLQQSTKLQKTLITISKQNAAVHRREAMQMRRKSAITDDGKSAVIMARLQAATSGMQDRDARMEIISRMALAIAEGDLKPRDIERRLREFRTDHYRMFSKFGPASLDQKVFEDGSETLGDRITQGLWQ